VRQGRAVVLGPVPAEARAAIAREARRVGARVVEAGCREHPLAAAARLPLAGEHQRDNLQVAVRVLEEARRAGLRFVLEDALRGIARTRWRGRLQRIPGRPPLLLDGAHNPAGARALGQYLREGSPFVLLFGVMADKDVRGLARELFPLARAVVLTRPRVGRAAAPADIARRTRGLAHRLLQEPDVRQALARARRLARPGDTVVVAGSLYLVGEVLAAMRPRKWSRASGRSQSATPR
jgi:dihydrofolate synthase/folylpolyglutamate synthase